MSSFVVPSAVVVDAKELAGDSFAAVARRTRDLFPDPAYRPHPDPTGTRLNLGPHTLSVNSDGTGTKPELAERLYEATGETVYFERPAHDVVAMVADDAARHGQFTIGIVNCVDINSAENQEFIEALAKGMEQACVAGRFPLINGETAELGYRVPGMGDARLNWNAMALALVNESKLFRAENLKPGQPIVALRERTIRSNGLTRARAIIEQAYLSIVGATREEWFARRLAERLALSPREVARIWTGALRFQPWLDEHVVIPWQETFFELTEKLSRPSTIYSPLIHAATIGTATGPSTPPCAAWMSGE